LGGVLRLATFELGIVGNGTVGDGSGVDADTVLPGLIRILVPCVGSVTSGGRDSRRSRKRGETGTGRLSGVGTLATLELGIVGGSTTGGGESVDTVTIGPVNIIVGIPDINSSSSSRRDGRRGREVGKTGSRSLSSIFTLATFELGIVDNASNWYRSGVDTLSYGPVGTVRIPSVRSSRGSGGDGRRSRKRGETCSRRLLGVGTLTTF
jgi:hypothetical protein